MHPLSYFNILFRNIIKKKTTPLETDTTYISLRKKQRFTKRILLSFYFETLLKNNPLRNGHYFNIRLRKKQRASPRTYCSLQKKNISILSFPF